MDCVAGSSSFNIAGCHTAFPPRPISTKREFCSIFQSQTTVAQGRFSFAAHGRCKRVFRRRNSVLVYIFPIQLPLSLAACILLWNSIVYILFIIYIIYKIYCKHNVNSIYLHVRSFFFKMNQMHLNTMREKSENLLPSLRQGWRSYYRYVLYIYNQKK